MTTGWQHQLTRNTETNQWIRPKNKRTKKKLMQRNVAHFIKWVLVGEKLFAQI